MTRLMIMQMMFHISNLNSKWENWFIIKYKSFCRPRTSIGRTSCFRQKPAWNRIFLRFSPSNKKINWISWMSSFSTDKRNLMPAENLFFDPARKKIAKFCSDRNQSSYRVDIVSRSPLCFMQPSYYLCVNVCPTKTVSTCLSRIEVPWPFTHPDNQSFLLCEPSFNFPLLDRYQLNTSTVLKYPWANF